MIIDAYQYISKRQAIAGTTNSTDTNDLGEDLPPSIAPMAMNLCVHSLTGALSVTVTQSADGSSFTTLISGSTSETGLYAIKVVPTLRYVRIQYSATAANVSAWLSPEPAAEWRALPDSL